MTQSFARVPATSANVGPGFDALGMALTLYADIGLYVDESDLPPKARLIDEHHLATIAFRLAGGTGALWERSPIPMGRGLGYSAAVRVGGLLAAFLQRHDGQLDQDQLRRHRSHLLAVASELEGHADNAAPAILGGLVATAEGHCVKVPLGFDPAVVCWVPTFSTRTDQSRAKMGSDVAWDDAVFNIGRVALLVAACAAGDVEVLRIATQDRLHQPQRFAQSEGSRAAYEAALANGAWACWLSGSGPTVAAWCAADDAERIASALASDGHTKILRIDTTGAHVAQG